MVDGFLNILKPPGMTSHDVVELARRTLKKKDIHRKVGHTGTLDPLATGVLPLCMGAATKMASFLLEGKKTYRGEITFGITTSTLDAAGEITSRKPGPVISTDKLIAVCRNHTGIIEQIPPAYSAVRYQGRRYYQLARENLELPPPKARQVTIYRLEVKHFDAATPFPGAICEIECSGGTYIRSLAETMGKEMGCGAYLSFLLRTKSGPFCLNEAVTIDEFTAAVENDATDHIIYPVDYPLGGLPAVTVTDSGLPYILNGTPLYTGQIETSPGDENNQRPDWEQLFRIYDGNALFRGLGKWQLYDKGPMFKPVKIIHTSKEINTQ